MFDARENVIDGKTGFENISANAQPHCPHYHVTRSRRRQHQHRQLFIARIGAQAAYQFQPPELGHFVIENHQMDGVARQQLERGSAVGSGERFVSRAPERGRQQFPTDGIVVDHQEGEI
jgi:hypothetical protein